MGKPPASEASDWAAASRALASPALTAAATRSSSSSVSPSATSLGSIRIDTTSSRPLTLAVTAPPPEVPSTWSCPSASVALATDSRSLPAFRINSARFPS